MPATRSRRTDSGVLLLDVLIGMALLSLVVLFAIQITSGVRAKGHHALVMSDARQIGHIVTVYTVENGDGYPSVVTQEGSAVSLGGLQGNLSKDDQMYYSRTTDGFKVCVWNDYAWAMYDSTAGAVTQTARGARPSVCGVFEAEPGEEADEPLPDAPPVSVEPDMSCPLDVSYVVLPRHGATRTLVVTWTHPAAAVAYEWGPRYRPDPLTRTPIAGAQGHAEFGPVSPGSGTWKNWFEFIAEDGSRSESCSFEFVYQDKDK